MAHRELVLIVLAFVLALGGEPVVSLLARHRWPRALAVTAVVVVALATVAGFVSLVVPVVVEQAGQLPGLLRGLQDPHTLWGRINTRFGVQGAVQQYLDEGGSRGLLRAGQAVFGALGSGPGRSAAPRGPARRRHDAARRGLVGWGVVGFFVAYRVAEDYLVIPFVVGRVVKVPALVTLLAVLLGAALYGIVGVLLGVPVAAAVHLLTQEIVFPRLDHTPPPARSAA